MYTNYSTTQPYFKTTYSLPPADIRNLQSCQTIHFSDWMTDNDSPSMDLAHQVSIVQKLDILLALNMPRTKITRIYTYSFICLRRKLGCFVKGISSV